MIRYRVTRPHLPLIMIIKAAASVAGLRAAAPSISPNAKGMMVLGIRGGAAGASAVLNDFASDADGYFGAIRTPASLILGASLGALFTNINDRDEMAAKTKGERQCTRLYNSCVLLSFMLSLCTVVFSTAAGVTIMHGGFDPMAKSAYDLMMKEFEFEFITTRLSYLSSLLSFIVGITGRVLLEYKLLRKEKSEEAYAVCFGMGAIVMHLWSYINSTLYSSQSLIGLAIRLGKLTVQRAVHEHRPLQVLSLGCFVISTYFLTRVLLFKKKGKVDDVIL